MSRRGPERLGDALDKALSARGLDQALRLQTIREKWRAAVGEEIAGRTRVVGFRRGVLQVEVTSSALLQELAAMYKEGITRSLASGEQPLAVRDIRFHLPG